MGELRRLCVFCGSSFGRGDVYRRATTAFADLLIDCGIGVVYGGAAVGLMGLLADRMLESGGEVIGVIPRYLVDIEIAHAGLTELHVVESIGERKELMAEMSDGFVALPGGLGTLEEIFEMAVRSQLHLHEKPCGLLNVDGYWDGLSALLDHAADVELLKPANLELLLFDDDPVRLVNRMRTFEASPTEKWIDN